MERGNWGRGDGADASPKEIARGVAYLRDRIVNLFFVGEPGVADQGWVLVDAGLHGSADRIEKAAEARFGPGVRPTAIVLTHGHFDHVGALETLAERWSVPVYAHPLELPYLTGRSTYPPPDPTVGGGAMARLAALYPKGPIDLRERVQALPEDGSVPGMPGWRWVFTPGHAPGHVSFFRDDDRTLIAGDAFVTTKQESAIAVLQQRQEIHGPPMYFTPDWEAARASVERLAELEPVLAATGHGVPMKGEPLLRGLRTLARDFDRLAKPAKGRYVDRPAVTDERGVVDLPPARKDPFPMVVAGVAAAAIGMFLVARRRRSEDDLEL
jgi:glyoxylase-like metal-dependent hydrolase (beta-lactamase superfamily II)